MNLRPLLDSDMGNEALTALCKPERLRPETVRRLVEIVQAQSGRVRRRGLFDQFDAALSDDG